jgi:hypothetical protein
MFLSACREVAKSFPDITYDEDLLDRVCLQVGIIGASPYLVMSDACRWKGNAESKALQ